MADESGGYEFEYSDAGEEETDDAVRVENEYYAAKGALTAARGRPASS